MKIKDLLRRVGGAHGIRKIKCLRPNLFEFSLFIIFIMKESPKRLSKGTFLEGQNGFSVVIVCVINISRNGCYHGLYLRKLHWFTLEFVQKVTLVVENELSKVGDIPRFSK